MKNEVTLTIPRTLFLELMSTNDTFWNHVMSKVNFDQNPIAAPVQSKVFPPLKNPIELEREGAYVNSSVIRHISFNRYSTSSGTNRGDLNIVFEPSGNAYRYSSVPVEVYQAFLVADSYGEFYNRKVKGVYRSEKID